MSKKKTSGSVFKVVALILLLVLIGGAVAVIYRYTNGFNEDFKTFYLEYEGEKIMQGKSELTFSQGSEVKFGVKYTFDFGDEARDYGVKIMPNEEESFKYTAGNRSLTWRASAETEDLSKIFGLKKDASSFTLTIPADMTIKTVLEAVYAGQEVTVDAAALKNKPLYRLEVSSYNGESVFVVNFSIGELPNVSLELDKYHIVFGGAGDLIDDEPIGGDKAPNVDERPVYSIFVETQGNGSVSSIHYSVTGGAHAGDEMTFAVSLTDPALSIGNILMMEPESDEDEQVLGDGEGTFTFTMPPHDVCITVYLLYK